VAPNAVSTGRDIVTVMAVLLGAAGVARWRPTATAHRPRRPAGSSTAIPLGSACATAGVETQQHILTGLESR
jgi:hypothetical protein